MPTFFRKKYGFYRRRYGGYPYGKRRKLRSLTRPLNRVAQFRYWLRQKASARIHRIAKLTARTVLSKGTELKYAQFRYSVTDSTTQRIDAKFKTFFINQWPHEGNNVPINYRYTGARGGIKMLHKETIIRWAVCKDSSIYLPGSPINPPTVRATALNVWLFRVDGAANIAAFDPANLWELQTQPTINKKYKSWIDMPIRNSFKANGVTLLFHRRYVSYDLEVPWMTGRIDLKKRFVMKFWGTDSNKMDNGAMFLVFNNDVWLDNDASLTNSPNLYFQTRSYCYDLGGDQALLATAVPVGP